MGLGQRSRLRRGALKCGSTYKRLSPPSARALHDKINAAFRKSPHPPSLREAYFPRKRETAQLGIDPVNQFPKQPKPPAVSGQSLQSIHWIDCGHSVSPVYGGSGRAEALAKAGSMGGISYISN